MSVAHSTTPPLRLRGTTMQERLGFTKYDILRRHDDKRQTQEKPELLCKIERLFVAPSGPKQLMMFD